LFFLGKRRLKWRSWRLRSSSGDTSTATQWQWIENLTPAYNSFHPMTAKDHSGVKYNYENFLIWWQISFAITEFLVMHPSYAGTPKWHYSQGRPIYTKTHHPTIRWIEDWRHSKYSGFQRSQKIEFNTETYWVTWTWRPRRTAREQRRFYDQACWSFAFVVHEDDVKQDTMRTVWTRWWLSIVVEAGGNMKKRLPTLRDHVWRMTNDM
jgi:hypothetical protein